MGRGDRIPGARHPDHAEVGLAEAALDARAALQFHVEIEPLILPNIAERSLLAEVLRPCRTTAKIVSSLAYGLMPILDPKTTGASCRAMSGFAVACKLTFNAAKP